MRVALVRLMGLAGREVLRLSDDRAAGAAPAFVAGAQASVRGKAPAVRAEAPSPVARRPGTDLMQTSSNPDRTAWSLALAATAVLGSLASACLMPFVAVAVATALTMSRARAAATVAAIWAVNQIIGFGFLGFPPTAMTIAWGVALGLAALAATSLASHLLAGRKAVEPWLLFVFASAFVTYEGVLLAFGAATGRVGAFTPDIVVQILANDAVWCAALIALHVALTRTAPRMFGPALTLRFA